MLRIHNYNVHNKEQIPLNACMEHVLYTPPDILPNAMILPSIIIIVNSGCYWTNTMIASDSFVFPGNVNLVFPSYCSCKREIYRLSSKFPSCMWYASGKFSGRQKISLSTNFPSLKCRGKLEHIEILCFPLNFPLAYRMHEGDLEDKVLFALRSQNVR